MQCLTPQETKELNRICGKLIDCLEEQRKKEECMPPGGPVECEAQTVFNRRRKEKPTADYKSTAQTHFFLSAALLAQIAAGSGGDYPVVDFWAFAIHPHRKDHRRRADWRGFRRTAGADRLIVCRAGPFQPDRRTGKLSEYLGSAAYYLRYA